MRKIRIFDEKIVVGISDLEDGTMRAFDGENEDVVIENQKKLCEQMGISPDLVARVKTVYQGRDEYTFYDEVTSEGVGSFSIINEEMKIPTTDGLATKCKDVGFLLPLADCIGIVVYDKQKQILGLLHAGRHNVEQYGPKKYIEYLCGHFKSKPEDLMVYFSPCAQNYTITSLNNTKMPDAAKEQLLRMGVLEQNIVRSNDDTVTDKRYPSCSAGDKTRRFAVVVSFAN